MRDVALVAKYLASEYEVAGRIEEAEAETRRALDLDERRLESDPVNATVMFDVSNDLIGLSAHVQTRGDTDAARPLLLRALDLRRRMAAADPRDVLAPAKVGSVLWRLAHNELRAGAPAAARPWADEAVRTLLSVRAKVDDVIVQRDLAAAHVALALSLNTPATRGRRCDQAAQAQAVTRALAQRDITMVWPLVDVELPGLTAACAGR